MAYLEGSGACFMMGKQDVSGKQHSKVQGETQGEVVKSKCHRGYLVLTLVYRDDSMQVTCHTYDG